MASDAGFTSPCAASTQRGAAFWVSAGAGWGVVAFGLAGVLRHSIDTRPTNLARFAVGGAVLHDAIVAPAVLVIGVLVARFVPARLRAVVQAALIISACLCLFSWPLVRDYAARLRNPLSLPRNYTVNLLVALGGVWAPAVAALGVGMTRRRRGLRGG